MRLLARLAWRNLWRQKRRSMITAAAMAVAVALSMASMAVSDGMFAVTFNLMVEQQLGHAQIHDPAYHLTRQPHDTVPEADAVIAALSESPEVVAFSPKLNGFGLIGGEKSTVAGPLLGVLPDKEAQFNRADERIVEGRWLSDEPAAEIVLGVGLSKELHQGVGGTVVVVTQASDGSLGNALYEVVGLSKTGVAALDRSGAALHLYDLQDLLVMHEQVHTINVVGTDPDDLGALKQHLEPLAPGAEVLTWMEANPTTATMMDSQVVVNAVILGIVFAVASFGVLNTMMMSVFERTRELGVLKAIGLRPSQMIWMVIFESLFLALVAGALGLALGGALDLYLVNVGLDFSTADGEGLEFLGVTLDPYIKGLVDYGSIALVLVALTLVSALASLYPAWRASRLVPVQALRDAQ